MAAEWGLVRFQEGFEDDAAWGLARSPMTAPLVNSQGIRWETNHPDAPAFNNITTGPGPARTGMWGVWDSGHGYATGSEIECDVDDPDTVCLYFDGFSGIRDPTRGVLNGVGKVGQALYIWGDDYTMLTPAASPVEETMTGSSRIYFAGAGPNPSDGRTSLLYSTPAQADVQLIIYDVRGRLVRTLIFGPQGAGSHFIDWDGRDKKGRSVSAGTYFGLLRVNIDGRPDTQVRKMVVTHQRSGLSPIQWTLAAQGIVIEKKTPSNEGVFLIW
jgi:hypothetical protein